MEVEHLKVTVVTAEFQVSFVPVQHPCQELDTDAERKLPIFIATVSRCQKQILLLLLLLLPLNESNNNNNHNYYYDAVLLVVVV